MEPITRKEIYLNQIAKNTGGNGGETGLTPITREEMYFDAIVKNTASGGGGGSDLPAVTAEDDGDVLTVVNGAWDKAAPSGGDIVMLHIDEESLLLDKTWQEINDAFIAGKRVVFVSESEDAGQYNASSFVVVATHYHNLYYVIETQTVNLGIGIPSQVAFQQFITDSAHGYPAPNMG